jgi:hypothetical protein
VGRMNRIHHLLEQVTKKIRKFTAIEIKLGVAAYAEKRLKIRQFTAIEIKLGVAAYAEKRLKMQATRIPLNANDGFGHTLSIG